MVINFKSVFRPPSPSHASLPPRILVRVAEEDGKRDGAEIQVSRYLCFQNQRSRFKIQIQATAPRNRRTSSIPFIGDFSHESSSFPRGKSGNAAAAARSPTLNLATREPSYLRPSWHERENLLKLTHLVLEELLLPWILLVCKFQPWVYSNVSKICNESFSTNL